jgi:lactoylglutathione lyase
MDLEKMKNFYTKYFGMNCGEKYTNPKKHFSSYFLSFPEGARLEIMHRSDINSGKEDHNLTFGLTHFAISVGIKNKVDELTETFRQDGFRIAGEPRTTGDGYYESVILDPEGNQVEITE